MNATQYEDLMQAVLDGAATPKEEVRLQAALAADARLRNRYQELQRLFGLLESVGEVEPPEGALDEILRQVREHATLRGRTRSRSSHRSGFGATWEAVRRSLTPQLAYAFATGAIAGVALLFALDGQPRPDLQVRAPGTVRWLQPLEEARIVDTALLQGTGDEARVRSGDLAGDFFLEIECQLTSSGVLEIEWEGEAAELLGMQRFHPQGDLTLRPRGARISAAGENRFRLWLAAVPQAPVRVRLLSGEETREAIVSTEAHE